MRISRRHVTRSLAIVGVALATVVAAACSSGSGSSGTSANGKVTITEFDYFTGGGNEALEWYNQQFMKEHPNITVKRTQVPYADLITKILQDASAGDMPNVMLIDNPDVPEVAAPFLAATPLLGEDDLYIIARDGSTAHRLAIACRP